MSDVASNVSTVVGLCRDPERDGLRAVRATLGIDGNLAQALRALPGCGIGGRRRFAHARDQEIYRGYDEEIYSRSYQQKRDSGIDEVSDSKHAAVDGELDGGEIGLADDRCNQRSEQVFCER